MKWMAMILLILHLPLKAQEVFTIPDSLFDIERYEPLVLLPYTKYTELSQPIDRLEGLPGPDNLKTIPEGFRYKKNTDYWFQLQMTADRNEEVYLNLGYLIAEATVFVQGNEVIELHKTGGRVWPDDKPIISDFIFDFVPLNFQNSDTLKLDLIVKNGVNDNAWINLSIIPASFYKKEWAELKSRCTFFLAVFVVMIFYHLFIYIISREVIYLTYVVWGIFVGTYVTCIYFLPYFLPAWHTTQVALICMSVGSFVYLVFNIQFLNLKARFKLGYHLLRITSLLLFTLAIPNLIHLLFDYALPGNWQRPTIIAVGFMAFIVFVVAMKVSWKGDPLSRYFFIVNAIFLITVVLAVTIFFLGTGYTSPYENRQFVFLISGIGGTSQTMLFGLIMGYRIFHLQKEKSQALEEKVQLQAGINLELEQKVLTRTAELQSRNKENELLLGEIHHRVKNNLQIISSLLKLQSRQLEEGKARSAVLEGRDRVKSMALIHQRLYQQERFSAIEMHDYIQNLVHNLAESYGYQEKDYQFQLKVAPLFLDVDTAVPLGLIVNELVSNVFKHAFTQDSKNRLGLELIREKEELHLCVTDNGPGFYMESINSSRSFGMELIRSLAQELQGTANFKNGDGAQAQFQFRNFNVQTPG